MNPADRETLLEMILPKRLPAGVWFGLWLIVAGLLTAWGLADLADGLGGSFCLHVLAAIGSSTVAWIGAIVIDSQLERRRGV